MAGSVSLPDSFPFIKIALFSVITYFCVRIVAIIFTVSAILSIFRYFLLFPVLLVRAQQKQNPQCTLYSRVSCLRFPNSYALSEFSLSLFYSYQNSHALCFHRMLPWLSGRHLPPLSMPSVPYAYLVFPGAKQTKSAFHASRTYSVIFILSCQEELYIIHPEVSRKTALENCA